MVTTTYMIIEGDSRLTNARTPTSHASTHGFSGSDPLPQATASQSGLLASTDFTTFSNKQDAALINDWSSASSTNYPSSSLVKAKIAECEPTENKVSSWSSTTTNVHFPSEKLVKDSLDEKQNEHSTATATLTVAGWSSKSQTVSVTGVTASNTVFVAPAGSSYSDYATSLIRCTAQASGTLTFVCDEVPSSAVTVNVVILA